LFKCLGQLSTVQKPPEPFTSSKNHLRAESSLHTESVSGVSAVSAVSAALLTSTVPEIQGRSQIWKESPSVGCSLHLTPLPCLRSPVHLRDIRHQTIDEGLELPEQLAPWNPDVDVRE
jgi:hypothetical protein